MGNIKLMTLGEIIKLIGKNNVTYSEMEKLAQEKLGGTVVYCGSMYFLWKKVGKFESTGK